MLFQTSLYLALAICLAGLLWRCYLWLSITIGPPVPGGIGRRLLAVIQGIAAALTSRRLMAGGVAVVRDALLQLHLLKAHPLRWLMHFLIFWGFLLLLLFHAFDDSVTRWWFPDYASTVNPFFFLRNLLGALVLLGVLLALVRRCFLPALKRLTTRRDTLALALLAAILLTGFLLEATQIVSEPIFDEMVADYHGDEDPEEVAALKAIWARDYHVVFDPPATVTDALITAGAALNEESCTVCHSRPTAAFASLPLAMAITPVAPALNRMRADIWFWHLHYLLCFLGLALLPFTKYRHLVTTPLTLVLRAGDPQTEAPSPPALTPTRAQLNRRTRRALTLDGCTFCGACSRHCSVAPSAEIIANPLILPSEKLSALRRATRRHGNGKADAAFAEGSYICTECYRCTRLCPAGLDLQDLWRASKADLARHSCTDLHALAVKTPASTLFDALRAGAHAASANRPALDVPKVPTHAAAQGMALCDDPATFQACVQCAVCSSVCPVVAAACEPDQDPEIGPHLVTNLLRMGQPELAQASGMVWSCVTCYQCQENCPQHIRVADLLYELRNRAWDTLKQAAPPALPTDLEEVAS
ncbi:MAG: 4Fe-4S dicluster domain-containing protein [Desulfosarcinaceae bacterium]|nr:4Fe-4S dicluster domain-containing protein [Desulfosarcinaceae bacterium]